MTNHELLWTNGVFGFLIVCLLGALIFTHTSKDTDLRAERARNDKLMVRIQNLQSLVRIQDHLIVAKIDVVLDEHQRSKDTPPVAEHAVMNVDAVIASMSYCYDCQGLRAPGHFINGNTRHRKTPAPDLVES